MFLSKLFETASNLVGWYIVSWSLLLVAVVFVAWLIWYRNRGRNR